MPTRVSTNLPSNITKRPCAWIPICPDCYLNLGLAYFKSKRLPEAATAFEEAVRADSNSFQARALLGMSYYGSARYADAAPQLKLASAAQPDNLELRYTLAQSYLLSNQYPEALAEFQFLLSKNPDSAPAHVLLGETLDASNRVAAATTEFEAAVKATPVPPDAHFGLGYLYWKQRRYEDACREFEAELAAVSRSTRRPWPIWATRKCIRTGQRPRSRTFGARWDWIRPSGLRTWILGFFWPQGTIPKRLPTIFARRSGSTLPSRMLITVWPGCGVPWAVSRRRRPSSRR